MKKLIILFLLSSISLPILCQPLTVPQTIDYLNNLSKDNPSSPFQIGECMAEHYKIYDLNEDGTFVINEYRRRFDCRNNQNKTFLTYKKSINIFDIDIDGINISQRDYIEIPCKQGNCLLIEKGKDVPGMAHFDKSKLEIFESTNYLSNKTFNAIVYLLKTASESEIYNRNDLKDPFAPSNFQDPRYKIESNNNFTEVSLSKEGGVHTLTVNFGNGIIRKFIIDSGASELAISNKLERDLMNSGIIQKKDYLTPGLYQIADGSIISSRRILIPKLKVGDFTVYNVKASIGNYSSPLLLGQSLLNKFKRWSIDNSNQILVLEK